MKILIVDTYYHEFLNSFYNKNIDLKLKKYATVKKRLIAECFGTSDYYSHHLMQLGHEAWDVIANDKITQQKWADEHNVRYFDSQLYDLITSLPYLYRIVGRSPWIQQIVLAQAKYYQPRIIYVQDLSILTPRTMNKLKSWGIMLVGQIACPLPPKSQLIPFNLILTSFPHYVDYFRKLGINSEYFRIGFDERLPKLIGKHKRQYEVSFIGSFSPHHIKGTRILESLSRMVKVHIWGQGLSKSSPLYKNYHGEAWGREMYKILASSKIVINRHISSSKNYANNMRLYESTGMGAMLITDNKSNLNKLFNINREVVTYSNEEDLIKKVQYYLSHEVEREKIAKNGQRRTLKEHTYKTRIVELTKIIGKYL